MVSTLQSPGNMVGSSRIPDTRVSLLLRIQDPADHKAWNEFIGLYASIVYAFARKRGLQDSDAADLMQEVFRSIAKAIGGWTYDSNKGKFRSWLYAITRNKVFNFLDAQRRQPRGSGDSNIHRRLDEQSDGTDEREEWDREYERKTFAWAAEQIEGEFHKNTWRAFWMTAVEDKSVKEVGDKLGMSAGAIYVAKSRVIARLREKIAEVREDD